ncbi:MAG: hypothetical protein V2A54_02310, partial [Bacteroidota bacterium]
MKHFFFILIFALFIDSYLCGQVRFSKLYPGENSDICQNVIVQNDGYIMCTSTDTLGYRCFRLIKVDLEGNVVWKKKYGYLNQQWYEGWENSLFNTS